MGSLLASGKVEAMQPESDNNLRLEIGHVLFNDLVGYSKSPSPFNKTEQINGGT